MYKSLTHSVPYFEHPAVEAKTGVAANGLNWDDIRIFVSLAQHLSFRSSGEIIGVAPNTVRRQIDRLESAANCKLFSRRQTGLSLTREGVRLLQSANQMAELAQEICKSPRLAPSRAHGRVRIAVTEGLGTLWLIPRLVKFQRAYPGILLETNCSFRLADMAKLEADIAIQLTEPKLPGMTAVKLGHLHVMPYASAGYLRTFGTPKSLEDVRKHKIVEQLSPQIDVSAVDRLFPGKSREGFVSIATNTSTAHLLAVCSGAGLGMLPTYLSALGLGLQPVDIGLTVSHEIWMTYDPSQKKTRRIALTTDVIRQCFDKKANPWFGPKFIHPSELPLIDESLVGGNFGKVFLNS